MSIYLYVKTHNQTGLKYLGKTIRDPFKYRGSGVRWTSHLKKYGNDVSTEILLECQTNDEVRIWGLYYSNLWDVVNSNTWANLKPEEGDGGTGPIGYKHSDETKRKMRRPKSPAAIANMRKANNPRGKDGVWVNNGTIERCAKDISTVPVGWKTGRLLKPIPPSQKNKIWINNGVTSKMVFELEEGWMLGRVYKRK